MPNINTQALYDLLSSQYNIKQNFDEFDSLLKNDSDARKRIYDSAVPLLGNDLSYEQFSSMLTGGQDVNQPQPQDATPAAPQQPEPKKDDLEGKVQQDSTQGKRSLGKAFLTAAANYQPYSTMLPGGYDTAAVKQQKEQFREQYEGGPESTDAVLRAKEMQQEANEKLRPIQREERKAKWKSLGEALLRSASAAPGMTATSAAVAAGMSPSQKMAMEEATEVYKEYGEHKLVAEALDEAIDYVNAVADQSGVGKGIWDYASRLSTFDFGYSDIAKGLTLQQLAEKAESGEHLSEEEERVLDMVAQATYLTQLVQDGVRMGYNVGASLPQSLGFIAGIALNPASEMGKRMMKRAAKKYGERAFKTMATRALGDVAEMGIATVTTGSGRVLADAIDRVNGDVTYDITPEGYIAYGGQENQETLWNATAKAFGSNFIENYTEALGDYFSPLGKMLGDLTSKNLRRIPKLGGLVDFINTIPQSQWGKMVGQFMEATKFNGIVGEILEEEIGMFLEPVFVGDSTMAENFNIWSDDPEIADRARDNQLTTILSCALMSGMLYGVQGAGVRGKLNRELAHADREGKRLLGEDSWNEIHTLLDSADGDVESLERQMKDIIYGKELTNEQRIAIINYAAKMVQTNQFNASKDAARQEMTKTASELAAAYDAGYRMATLDMPQHFRGVRNDLMYSEDAISEYDKANPDANLLEVAHNLTAADMATREQILQGLPAEQSDLVKTYLACSERFNGLYQGTTDAMDADKMTFIDMVRPAIITNPDGQQVVRTATSAYGEQVYVVGGEGKVSYIMGEDGLKRAYPTDQLKDVNEVTLEELDKQFDKVLEDRYMARLEHYTQHNEQTQEPVVGMVLGDGNETFVITDMGEGWATIQEATTDQEGNATPKPDGKSRDVTKDYLLAFQDQIYDRRDAMDGNPVPSSIPAAQQQEAEDMAQQRELLQQRAEQWAAATGVQVRIIDRMEDVDNEEVLDALDKNVLVAGWYNTSTGEVCFYTPNIKDVSEVDKTFIHEVVGHKGMRLLLGEQGYNELCNRVWNELMSEEDRQTYMSRLSNRERSEQETRLAAADEFIAYYAEKMQLSPTEEDSTIWEKFVQMVKDILSRLGIGEILTEGDLSGLLQASLARYRQEVATAESQAHVPSALESIPTIAQGTSGAVDYDWVKAPDIETAIAGMKESGYDDDIIRDYADDMVRSLEAKAKKLAAPKAGASMAQRQQMKSDLKENEREHIFWQSIADAMRLRAQAQEEELRQQELEAQAEQESIDAYGSDFKDVDNALNQVIDEMGFDTIVAYYAAHAKYIWSDSDHGTKGFASHMFAARGNKRSERLANIGWLANRDKGGFYPEEVAEHILAYLPESIKQGHDTMETLDIVIETIRTANHPASVIRDMYAKLIQKQQEDELRQMEKEQREEELQQDAYAKDFGFADYQEMLTFEELWASGEDIVEIPTEQIENYYNTIYGTDTDARTGGEDQTVVQQPAGQTETDGGGNTLVQAEGADSGNIGDGTAGTEASTDAVLPGTEQTEVAQRQRTIYHPSSLVQAYQSGDEAQIAEAEKAMRDFILSTPEEDRRKLEVTMQQANDFIRKNKKDESLVDEVRMNKFILQCCKEKLTQIDKLSKDLDKPLQNLSDVEKFLISINYKGSASKVLKDYEGNKVVKYSVNGSVYPNIYLGKTTPREVLKQFLLYDNVMQVDVPGSVRSEFEKERLESKKASDALWADERKQIKKLLTDANIPFHDVIDSERGSRIVFTDRKNDNGNYLDWEDVADAEYVKEEIERIREKAEQIQSKSSSDVAPLAKKTMPELWSMVHKVLDDYSQGLGDVKTLTKDECIRLITLADAETQAEQAIQKKGSQATGEDHEIATQRAKELFDYLKDLKSKISERRAQEVMDYLEGKVMPEKAGFLPNGMPIGQAVEFRPRTPMTSRKREGEVIGYDQRARQYRVRYKDATYGSDLRTKEDANKFAYFVYYIPSEDAMTPIEGKTPVNVMATIGYNNTGQRIAHGIKDGDNNSIAVAASAMVEYINDGDIIVPMPSHNGKATVTLELAKAIQKLTYQGSTLRMGVEVIEALEGSGRESLYETKVAGKKLPNPSELGLRLTEEGQKAVESGRHIVIVDNVIATGTTAQSALQVIPDGMVLAYAQDKSVKSAKEEKPATIRFREANEGDTDVRFRVANDNQKIFISNAAKAVGSIRQEKATPDQWLAMIQKQGGIKAGEDKWLGLSEWIKSMKAMGAKALTKQEIENFIDTNKIQIKEQRYAADIDIIEALKQDASESVVNGKSVQELQEEIDLLQSSGLADTSDMNPAELDEWLMKQMVERYGDDFSIAYYIDGGTVDHNIDPYEVENSMYNDEISEGKERVIDNVRLGYTTDGLEHKREIALWIPGIEQWDADDNVHFGDAGSGRAVVWMRFGDTKVKRFERDYKVVNNFEEPTKNYKGWDIYYPLGEKFTGHSYIVHGQIKTGEMRYVPIVHNTEFGAYETLEEARVAMNEGFKSLNIGSPLYDNILVVDEIQSKRHQEARERGYKNSFVQEELDQARRESSKYGTELYEKYILNRKERYGKDFLDYATDEERAHFEELAGRVSDITRTMYHGIPDAPFEKNWAELAMKRMLRLAAEEGYDKLAWTTGEQQADRYDIGRYLDYIERNEDDENGNKVFNLQFLGSPLSQELTTDNEGDVISTHGGELEGKTLSNIVGKDLAKKMLGLKVDEAVEKVNMRVGAEGMSTFYDQMLVNFMNKYGKQWGVKVEDVHLPGLSEGGSWENAGDQPGGGLIMHSVDITDQMKKDVIEGQVMFRIGDNDKTYDLNAKQKQPMEGYTPLTEEQMSIYSDWVKEQAKENHVLFRVVDDPLLIEVLETGKKQKGYRTVAAGEDGTLGSPMAGSLGKKGSNSVKTSRFEIGKWEQAEENPQMATEDGKVNLIKPNGRGSVGGVDYNPYIHIRPTSVNRQFTQAWNRPELVYIETEYPERELTSGYKAPKAKLSVGRHTWNGGELILSRWDKPTRIMPWDEVADEWAREFRNGVTFDIISPHMLDLLVDRGVDILPPKKAAGKAAMEAYRKWLGGRGPEGGKKSEETPRNTSLDEVLYRINVNHNSKYLLKKADGAFYDKQTSERLGFDHRFMSQGEGDQAHGWGSYFSKSDLRAYGDTDLNGGYLYKGKTLMELAAEKGAESLVAYDILNKVAWWGRGLNVAEAIKESKEEFSAADGDVVKDFLAVFDYLKEEDFKKSRLIRHHYDVTIPDDTGENYLDEQRSIPKAQRRRIADAVRKLEGDPAESIKYVKYKNGWDSLAGMIEREPWAYREIRDRMVQAFGGRLTDEERLSKMMSSLGYVGIHYDGRRDGECYVIFNENDARIENHTVFRIADAAKESRLLNDLEKVEAHRQLESTNPIDVKEKSIIQEEGKAIAATANEWAKKNIPVPVGYDTAAGRVFIDKRSVKDSVSHGVGQAKLDAITSLIEGFANATYIGSLPDSDGNRLTNHFFAYPINYNGERHYVFCRTREDENNHRLYVHEVFLEDELKKDAHHTAASNKPHGGILLYRDILSDILNANISEESESEKGNDEKTIVVTPEQDAQFRKAYEEGDKKKAAQMVKEAFKAAYPITKVIDKNGEPLVVYHGTHSPAFNVFAEPGENLQGLIWTAKNKSYAKSYATVLDGERAQYEDETGDVNVPQKDGIYRLFVNIENPIELENIDDAVGSDTWDTIARKFNLTPEELYNKIGWNYSTYERSIEMDDSIYELTRTDKFVKLLKENGYDGVFAREGGFGIGGIFNTYGVITGSQVKSAEPFTFDDNGELIPLSERFNPENNDIRLRVAEEQLGLFSPEEMNGGVGNSQKNINFAPNNNNKNERTEPDIQRQGDKTETPEGGRRKVSIPRKAEEIIKPLRQLKEGETCHVERKMTEDKNFSFIGPDKIETSSDVAYIFKELETKAVENAFLVFTGAEGTPAYILHIGMGHVSGSTTDLAPIIPMIESVKPSKLWLVHNHPSGNLVPSATDHRLLGAVRTLVATYTPDVEVEDGIIIDTTRGLYGTFGNGAEDLLYELEKSDIKNKVEYPVYKFDEQSFGKDYNPDKLTQIRNSRDIAQFVATHRLGERSKINILVVNNNLQIIGNFFSDITYLNKENAHDLARECARYTSATDCNAVIVYGTGIPDRRVSPDGSRAVGILNRALKSMDNHLVDATGVSADDPNMNFPSYYSYADHGALEETPKYGGTLFREIEERKPGETAYEYTKRVVGELNEQYNAIVPSYAVERTGTKEQLQKDTGLEGGILDKLYNRILSIGDNVGAFHRDGIIVIFDWTSRGDGSLALKKVNDIRKTFFHENLHAYFTQIKDTGIENGIRLYEYLRNLSKIAEEYYEEKYGWDIADKFIKELHHYYGSSSSYWEEISVRMISDIFAGNEANKLKTLREFGGEDYIDNYINKINYEQAQTTADSRGKENSRSSIRAQIDSGGNEGGYGLRDELPGRLLGEQGETRLRRAENETDTNPTEGQKEAGNYKKGHVRLFGMDLSIEQPKGSVRRGVDPSGKEWEQEMHNTYGYIRGTMGRDKDHIDVFLGDNLSSDKVFVIDQRDIQNGGFDEHKVMLGFDNIEAARDAYYSNYEESWTGLGAITETSLDDFKEWAFKEGRRVQPFNQTEGDGSVMFRTREPAEYQRIEKILGLAAVRYERAMDEAGKRMAEVMSDSMRSVKELQDAIAEETGKPIHDYENAYWAAIQYSSRNKAMQDAYHKMFYRPLLDEVYNLTKNAKDREEALDKLNAYLMAKHGLERNEKFAMRDAERDALEQLSEDQRGTKEFDSLRDSLYEKYRRRDYSGLTAMFDKKKVVEAEIEAQLLVDSYEKEHDTTELWRLINAATKETLRTSVQGGVLTEEKYIELATMFNNYVPLRGFDETTSDDVYGYYGTVNSPYNTAIKKAYGRRSLSDSPLATIGNIADSEIMRANRNRIYMAALSLAEGHHTGLMSVSEVMFRRDPATGEWSIALPDLSDADTPELVAQKMSVFRKWFAEQLLTDDVNYRLSSEMARVPYKVISKSALDEHQIIAMRGGKQYIITVNGNPRAAQALAGKTNPDSSPALNWLAPFNRFLAGVFTQYNPSFVLRNLTRDGIYTNSMVWAKEDKKYALSFNKNWSRVLANMAGLLSKYKSNLLDESHPIERYFREFIDNGGETGYTQLRSVKDYKKIMKRELNDIASASPAAAGRKIMAVLGEAVENMNRWAEGVSRFAAYLTSREQGRSVVRSVEDAKEISVNFNKKGSGTAALTDKERDEKLLLNVARVSQLGRELFVFFNAGVQGMANFTGIVKNNPTKAIPLLTGLFLGGAALAMMNGGGGDDDDEKDYYNLPEYIRRSNICLKVGKHWLTVPMPIELRCFYGLGELAYSVMSGNEFYEGKELAYEVASQLTQILPIDFLEGNQGTMAFVPSAVKPVVEAYWLNQDWTGAPIYNDSPFNENDPAWRKAFKSTSPALVTASRKLNEWTGGNVGRKGVINVNPARVEHLFEGYLGGVGTIMNQVYKSGRALTGDLDMKEVRNIPIVSGFVRDSDGRAGVRAENSRYHKISDMVDGIFNEDRRLRQMLAEKEISGYNYDDEAIKEANKRLQELRQSKEWEFAQQWRSMDKRRNTAREGRDEEEFNSVTKEMNELYKNFRRKN